MKRILLALLLSTSLLSGCGAKDSDHSLPAETNRPGGDTSNTERIEESEKTENPERTEGPEETEDTEQAEQEDVSGFEIKNS